MRKETRNVTLFSQERRGWGSRSPCRSHRSRNSPWLVLVGPASSRRAPGALPAHGSQPFPVEGGCRRRAPFPSPRGIHGSAPGHGPARRLGDFPASNTAVRSPAHTTGGLFAELQLIYGPCYLNINYGPARQAPRLLPSRLIIF